MSGMVTGCDSSRDLPTGMYAVIKTNRGEILVSLEYEKTPITITSFVGLAEGSIKTPSSTGPFFDGLTFHRVVENFVVQGGDPLGDGTGGPGYQFPTEIFPGLEFSDAGVLGMARSADPNSNGSQFFITLNKAPHLNGQYTVFGHVVEGVEVVGKLEEGDDIKKIEILRVGPNAEAFVATKEKLDVMIAEQMKEQKEQEEKEIKVLLDEINNRWPNAVVTSEGIRFIINKEGTGVSPEVGQTAVVHYTGKFLDGGQFDSSVDRDEPFEFTVGKGQVIQGWDKSVLDMKVGESRTIILPPEMAYGEQGAGGGIIPPNAWLVFDVELLDIK